MVDFSDKLSALIDKEVTDLVKKAEENAFRILTDNIEILHNVAKALLDYETITGEQMEEIIKNGSIDIDNKKNDSDRPRRRKKNNIDN